jgi:hypothetical protein
LREELSQCKKLNLAVQEFLREWSRVSEKRNPAVMLDHAALPWFAELNRGLNDRLDDPQFRDRIRASTVQLQTLAHEMLTRARSAYPGFDGPGLRNLQALTEQALASSPSAAEPTLLAEFG